MTDAEWLMRLRLVRDRIDHVDLFGGTDADLQSIRDEIQALTTQAAVVPA